MKKILGAFSALVLLAAVGVASAAPVAAIDVTEAATSLTNQIPSMTTILTTVLGLVAVTMAFGWIRKVMH